MYEKQVEFLLGTWLTNTPSKEMIEEVADLVEEAIKPYEDFVEELARTVNRVPKEIPSTSSEILLKTLITGFDNAFVKLQDSTKDEELPSPKQEEPTGFTDEVGTVVATA